MEWCMLIFGSTIVDQLAAILISSSPITDAVRACASSAKPFSVTDDGKQVCLAAERIVRTFIKMRSREYVCQFMGPAKGSLAQGTRAMVAVISEYGSGSKKKKTKQLTICYLCGAEGHIVTHCTKLAVAPNPDEPSKHTVKVPLGDGSGGFSLHTWNWCVECVKWRRHSSEEHREASACAVAVDDDTESDDEDEVEQECLEMNNVIAGL